LALRVISLRCKIWSLLGHSGHCSALALNGPVANDPKRHFATSNYRIAKGSFARDVEVSMSRDMACSLSLVPLASFDRWRGRSTAGPSHHRALREIAGQAGIREFERGDFRIELV
jgi:hypothetical protein